MEIVFISWLMPYSIGIFPFFSSYFHQTSFLFCGQTTSKGGAYSYDIHFWIGKDSSQVCAFDFLVKFFLLVAHKIEFMNYA